MDAQTAAELLDWKRQIFALYGRVRAAEDPRLAWDDWRATRDELFRNHPQSPIPSGADFDTVPYFDYDPEARVLGEIVPAEEEHLEVVTSTDGTYGFARFATVNFSLLGTSQSLDCLWVEGYGGGLFLSFRDETSGAETYGACRYLYDTIKGADLGDEGGRLVLDFNFAYNPSCSYDPKWTCPLAPPNNRLDLAIRAGERTP
jgi:uncharacterized protein (DUF1684 family)